MGEAARRKKLGIYPKQTPTPRRVSEMVQQQMNIKLEDAEQIKCECGCLVFLTGSHAFKISALVSPTGQDMVVNKGFLVCLNCQKIYQSEDFLGPDTTQTDAADGYNNADQPDDTPGPVADQPGPQLDGVSASPTDAVTEIVQCGSCHRAIEATLVTKTVDYIDGYYGECLCGEKYFRPDAEDLPEEN